MAYPLLIENTVCARSGLSEMEYGATQEGGTRFSLGAAHREVWRRVVDEDRLHRVQRASAGFVQTDGGSVPLGGAVRGFDRLQGVVHKAPARGALAEGEGGVAADGRAARLAHDLQARLHAEGGREDGQLQADQHGLREQRAVRRRHDEQERLQAVAARQAAGAPRGGLREAGRLDGRHDDVRDGLREPAVREAGHDEADGEAGQVGAVRGRVALQGELPPARLRARAAHQQAGRIPAEPGQVRGPEHLHVRLPRAPDRPRAHAQADLRDAPVDRPARRHHHLQGGLHQARARALPRRDAPLAAHRTRLLAPGRHRTQVLPAARRRRRGAAGLS